jgi:hypothetical protein
MALTSEASGLLGTLSSFSILAPIGGFLAIGLLALYVWNRTRSTHSLMSRLWQLFNGKRECKDAKTAAFLDAQSALMQFRFTTGVRARTGSQSHTLIEWAKRNNEDIGDIAACGNYFDLEKVSLRDELPRNRNHLLKFALTMALLLTLFTLCLGMLMPRAILTFKESGQVFTMTANNAKRPRADDGLSTVQCKDAARVEASGFSPHDAALICEMLNDPGISKYIRDALFEQRILLGFVALNVLAYFLGALRWLTQGIQACKMRDRLRSRSTSTIALEVTPE